MNDWLRDLPSQPLRLCLPAQHDDEKEANLFYSAKGYVVMSVCVTRDMKHL
jgi:hypothetical protein